MIKKRRRIVDRKLCRKIASEPCVISGEKAECCHIWSRGAGGPDEAWNMLPLAPRYHREQHQIGWIAFLFRYGIVRFHLRTMGWSWDQGRLSHPDKKRQAYEDEIPLQKEHPQCH